MMTREEVIRMLRRFRYDPAFKKGDGRVPLSAFCRYIGLSRQYIYDIINKQQRCGDGGLKILSAAIEDIVAGRIRFQRLGRYQWVVVGPDGQPVPAKVPQRYNPRTHSHADA